ncbi:hypothetical protein LguiA_035519 [Lonicera macranthoides]
MDYTQNARIARLRRRLIRESNSSRHCSDRQFHVNRISQREIRRHDAVQNISPSTDSLCQTTFFNNQKVGNFSTRRDIISHSIVTLDGKVVTTTLEPMANASNVANSNYCGYTITNIRAAIESSTLQHFSSVRNQVPALLICVDRFSQVRNILNDDYIEQGLLKLRHSRGRRAEKEEIVLTCKATIYGIDKEAGWFYNSCRLCGKKVKESGSTFWCSKCNNDEQFPKPRNNEEKQNE